jgi:hypothetical protein
VKPILCISFIQTRSWVSKFHSLYQILGRITARLDDKKTENCFHFISDNINTQNFRGSSNHRRPPQHVFIFAKKEKKYSNKERSVFHSILFLLSLHIKGGVTIFILSLITSPFHIRVDFIYQWSILFRTIFT